jgi:hypothetical protein
MYRIRIQEVDVMMLEGFSVPECGAEPPARLTKSLHISHGSTVT